MFKYVNIHFLLKCTCLFLTVCLSHFSTNAQLYHKGRVLTVANGLSDNRVTCFYEDKAGFIWIGTKNGLNRYDGHNIDIFRPADSNAISSEWVYAITGDKDGHIWVATRDGLNKYDPQKKQWQHWKAGIKDNPNYLPSSLIWDIHCDENGLLWIASDKFEFSSYDPKTKKFTYYDWPAFAKKQFATQGKPGYYSIKKILPKNGHAFWLGTNMGLASLDIQTGQFSFHGGGFNAEISDLRFDSIGNRVMLSIQGGSLYSFDPFTEKFSVLAFNEEPYPSTSFEQANDKDQWIASEKGLLICHASNRKVSLRRHIHSLDVSILPGGVNAVYTDKNGIRWVGTANGCMLFDQYSRQASFLPLLEVSGKEGSNRMTGNYFDPISGSYFVCSEKPAAVWIIQKVNGKIQKLDRGKDGRLFSACYAVKPDASGNIWLLTDTEVYTYDRQSDQFGKFPMPNNGSSAAFRDIAEDADGNWWFSSFNKGIYIYNRKAKRFDTLPMPGFRYFDRVATKIYADHKHREVWMASFGLDLYRYHLDTRMVTAYRETKENKEWSFLGMVNDIKADASGNIWMASNNGGLFRFNRDAGQENPFTRYDMRHGLPDNNVLSVAPDDQSRIWFLSGSGVSVIDNTGKKIKTYFGKQLSFDISSYESDPVFGHELLFDSANQVISVAVAGGLMMFSSKNNDIVHPFPLVYTSLQKNGLELLDNQYNPPGISLKKGTQDITIRFAGLYFGSSPEIVYEYRLKGYDKQWVKADDHLQVVFQNLPSGDYSFSARARNEQGDILGETAPISIEVNPPFWQSVWFITLLLLITAYIVYRIIRSLSTKLREEKLLKQFATSLFGLHSVDDIFWETANQSVQLLGLEDCVIYQLDEKRQMLVQHAAAGPKSPYRERYIYSPIEIPVGSGIVGSVALNGKPECVHDTAKDPRYIVDDKMRLSELAVPILIDAKTFGVIDSEHSKKKFFTGMHIRMLQKMASICSERISKFLAEEKIRSKIARDLHDDIGSALTSINIMSKVAMSPSQQESQVQGYLQKIKEHSSKTMESMSDIVWAINPANDSIQKLVIRMKEWAAEMLEPTGVAYHFDISGEIDQSILNLEERKDLYLIFKEAVHNAVKYSQCKEILIQLIFRDNTLTMTIKDNGKGFDKLLIEKGNGLANMHARAEAMKATFQITSAPGKGTVIVLEKHITS